MLLGGGGVHEALQTLGRDPEDWLIECAIIKAANEMDVEQKTALAKAHGALVGNRVGEILAKAFGA
jgi:hypothetical protein